MNDVHEVLRKSTLLSGLSDTDIEVVGTAATVKDLPSGAWLFKQNEPRRACFIVAQGSVEISRNSGEGFEQVMALHQGGVAGEASLLNASSHTASAKTITPTTIIEIEREKLHKALATNGSASVRVLTKIAEVVTRHLGARRPGQGQSFDMGTVRSESDLISSANVPDEALYGVQTLRAIENFPISGILLSHFPAFIRALAMVKQASARANAKLGLLNEAIAKAIDQACQEIIEGCWHDHFPIDMIQGGAGTSTNMNANEVIANRALEILGKKRGDYAECHPNDHVNMGQSTNDVYPTAIKVATVFMLRALVEALEKCKVALQEKGKEFSSIIKMGRTQLQDAVPMTLGQEFDAFAVTTGEDIDRLKETVQLFMAVNMGGTAIGTGICADPRYSRLCVEEMRQTTGLEIQLADNLVEATCDTGDFVLFSGVVKRTAIKLSKLCNDLRLLSSGPRCGLQEINLPARQPGSSIMPGKVNPVIPEVVNQVAFRVIGNDMTITMAAEAGQLQLNVMEPILALSLFDSLRALAAAVNTLTTRCIVGITANEEHCREMVENSIGIVTATLPAIGYKKATEAAKISLETMKPVRAILQEKGWLTPAQIDEILSPEAMTQPRR
ncbi:MAG: aspartate ammonia-lyase [Holophagaceae bacterium]|nr:aspartate ammonia-lyase [Holophagaceae bacterium]